MPDIELKVPDIGGYDDVPVIELLVKVGDTVAKDQGLVTLESDKATMEVPASQAGVVKELKVKLGDKVSEGSVIALIETTAAPAPSTAPAGEGRDGGRPTASMPPPQPSPASGERGGNTPAKAASATPAMAAPATAAPQAA